MTHRSVRHRRSHPVPPPPAPPPPLQAQVATSRQVTADPRSARLAPASPTARVDGGPATEFDPTWRRNERGEVM